MSGLFPGDKYTFEVKAVSKQQTSSEETATAVLCKLQHRFCHIICSFLDIKIVNIIKVNVKNISQKCNIAMVSNYIHYCRPIQQKNCRRC